MMVRLSLAARITMIVVVSLSAVWMASIAAYYGTHADELGGVKPSPARIAALVTLLESASPEQRATILKAVTTDTFRPDLQRSVAEGRSEQTDAVNERELREYAEALGGRAFTLQAEPASPLAKRFPRLVARSRNALEFNILLRTGEDLVIKTGGRLVLNRFGLPVGFGAGLFGTLVAIVALFIMQRETRPLRRLAAAVDRIDPAAGPAPLPEMRRSPPEIRALVAAFNRLQGRLGAMIHARMAMIGGISHDVRTFATRLRLRVEGIAEDSERRRAEADIDDMIRLLDDALLSSRAGAGELQRELVEFAALARQEVEDRRTEGAPVDLVVEPSAEHVHVLGDRLALRRIVTNITDNALKYGRVAHVRIGADRDRIVLTVEDEGPGIPAAQRDVILESFIRLDGSRSRETGGAGLGLAIVRTLTDAHGGSVQIGETPRGGCRVTVSLPVFDGR